MSRMLAAGTAIVMCLALGVLPVLAQEQAAAEEATTADVAPFHAVPDGSGVVEGMASCEISLGGEVGTEGEEAFLVVCTLDTSDPRVSGTERQDHYRLLAGKIGDGAVWVLDETLLTNDEGTWRGSVQAAEGRDSLPYGEAHYVGEGAYDGLAFHYYFFAPQVNDQAVVRGWISPISEPPAG